MSLSRVAVPRQTAPARCGRNSCSLSIQTSASEFEKDLAQATGTASGELQDSYAVVPAYRHPGKNWRLKKGAMPQWYKARSGVRTKALSGAARVARYRPQKFH